MIKHVYILGNHIQALGIARQVKGMDIGVYLFTSDKLSITRFSNAVNQSIMFSDWNDLLAKLTAKKDEDRHTLLFPTNDNMVSFLSAHYYELISDFYIGIPQPETVEIFYNKRNTYQFGEKHGIPVPQSWYPDNMAELEVVAYEVNYPVIIKPAIMHTFHKTFGKKAFKCLNPVDLINKAKWISQSFPMKYLIIQEFLAGGAKSLYSYGAFATNGKVIAALMANRIRQNPMDFGNSTTFAITCNIPVIKEYAEKILQLTNYFGLAEVEFMYDAKTDQYKFLEINTRAWKWHSISNGLGFGFINAMITSLNNEVQKLNLNFNSEVAWVERLTDMAVVSREMLYGRMKLRDVLKTYKKRKTYAVWSRKDAFPFFIYFVMAPFLFLKRH